MDGSESDYLSSNVRSPGNDSRKRADGRGENTKVTGGGAAARRGGRWDAQRDDKKESLFQRARNDDGDDEVDKRTDRAVISARGQQEDRGNQC